MKFWKYLLGALFLTTIVVWLAVFASPDKNLHIVACDVGQGDALLVYYKEMQILTDGGANNRVLDCLSKYMPFYDRKIELVVLTHPDRDHYFGLIEVFRRYKVDNFLYNPLEVSAQEYKALGKEVGRRGIKVIHPDRGMELRLGVIYLDMLHPSKDFEGEEINEYSIVYLLKFGDFKAIFTGDINQKISDQLSANGEIGMVNYLKVPHHGSKNGLSENLLRALDPKIGVISVGKNNRYGHPHKEIIEMLADRGVDTLRTDILGNTEVVSDGNRWWIKKEL